MRQSITILSFLCLISASCSDAPGQVVTLAEWRVDCPGDGFNCTPELPADKTIFQFNGQPGVSGETVRARCEATEDASGDFLEVVLEASEGDNTGFLIRNLRLGTQGGGFVASPGCEVTVTQEGFEYIGDCGGDAPSAEQPCELSDIDVSEEVDDDFGKNVGGPQVSVSVRCTELPSRQNAQVRRDVLGKGATPKALLRFAQCDGF